MVPGRGRRKQRGGETWGGQSIGATCVPEIAITGGTRSSRLDRRTGACPTRISMLPHFDFNFGVSDVGFGANMRVIFILHFKIGEDPPAGETAVIG